MELEQALKIAEILEQDDVISPVAMAARKLRDEVLYLQERLQYPNEELPNV